MSKTNVSSSPFVGLLRFATSLFVLIASVAAVAQTGRVTGTVSSQATGNALQGATVTLSTGRSVLTDDSGRYLFFDVPAGSVKITAAYSGFKDQTVDIDLTPGGSQEVAIVLASSDIVTLEVFTVTSVKEGQALSVTEQRNAANTKNVVALDEWGVLPTQNVGELFTRMPGVSFATDEDNLINNITIRGMVSSNGQSFTRLNIDGMSSTGVGGNGRTATLHSFSAAMYEQIEVIAGQTPDKRADGIGGQINLKTRSPLAMKEKRRFNYNVSGTAIPSSSERVTALKDHPFGYSGAFGYTEVFDVFGGNRNLGVSVNVSKQQVVRQFSFDLLQYSTNTGNPQQMYFRDYDKRSGVNHRFLDAISLRADYRLADHTTVSARFLYNSGDEPYFHYTFVNPFFSTNNTIYDAATNPSGGIVAGSTSTRTEIRPTGNAQMLLTPRRWSFTSRNPTGTLVFEHDFGQLKIDHSWRLSSTHWESMSGRNNQGGQLNLRTTSPIGFILDNTNVDGRVFTQTAGANVYDPASYTTFVVTAANTTTAPVPQTSNFLTKRNSISDTDEWSGNINGTYSFETAIPLTLKTGLDTVNREVLNRQINPRRWYSVAGTTLTGYDLMPITEFEENHGGSRLPVYDPSSVSQSLGDTTRWYEDINYNATQRYVSYRYMQESADSVYAQLQTKLFQKLTLLGGVRVEATDVETATYFSKNTADRTYVTTTQESDPYKRAALNYVRSTNYGKYTKRFPSLHAAYDITPNLKARASWSTSYGRPDLLQLVPAASVNDTAQTVTIGNPDLKPQMAKNIDLKLEYFFKKSGLVSVSFFQKTITDYLPPSGINFGSGSTVGSGPDNGFDGNYVGYSIVEPRNIGRVEVRGLELDYKQRLTFLPGALKGLSVRGNYTFLDAEGDLWFSATQTAALKRKTEQIPGMIPHTANLGLDYTFRKFGASFDLNHTGEYADTIITTQGLNTAQVFQGLAYRKELTTMSIGTTYRIKPYATLYLNVNNITEQGPVRYYATSDKPRQTFFAPRTVVFGVQGTF